MDVLTTPIPGLLRLRPPVHRDHRGTFVKTFHRETFRALGLHDDFPEEFHTTSAPGVLRGLHFQRPPHDHVKIVGCTTGAIVDVAVDLRRGSPTYGRHALLTLDDVDGELLYLPAGLAHGFLVVRGPAVVTYRTSTAHSPAHDAGVHWASAGVPWPLTGTPVTSERDEALPALADVESPFTLADADPATTGA